MALLMFPNVMAETEILPSMDMDMDMDMDAELKEAATLGNVEYLKQSLNSKPINYFLLSTENGYNIFHIAVRFQREAFINTAKQRLPKDDLRYLLSQQEISLKWNPLHFAAFQDFTELIWYTHKLFRNLEMETTSSSSSHLQVPWLMRDINGNIPLHLALKYRMAESAFSLLQSDERSQCDTLDKEGNSPFFLAVNHGLHRVALQILNSNHPVNVMGQHGLINPLHILAKQSDENTEDNWLEIEKLLIQKHQQLLELPDENGNSILHLWAKEGRLLLLSELLIVYKSKFLQSLSILRNNTGDTPLHLAVEHGNEEFALSLVKKCGKLDTPLWRHQNHNRLTPFDIALTKRLEKFVLHCISRDPWTYNERNSHGESRLYVAIKQGMNEVVQRVCDHVKKNSTTTSSTTNEDGQTILHAIIGCTEETGKMLVAQFPHLINKPDGNGKRPLDVASEFGKTWLIEVLLEMEPSSVKHSPKAWIAPCERSDLEALKLFTGDSDLFKEICIRNKDTPLHHVELRSEEEYKKLFAISPIWEMKNNCDINGQTPLHRALEREDLLLAEVLLKQGVDSSISDNSGTKAKGLLAKLCTKHYEWHALCKKMNLNPWLKTRYIQDTSTLGKVRDTLAVVAALLATLTFAAGFTLPGGLNQDTGEALVGKKASFLVFILADTYAMCCSMFVLFCLIWSMVCDEIQSHVLIDRSVLALVHSFCGTLVAFMTGIYTVLSHQSLWASILIIVMTSLVAVISCNKTFLYKVVDEWIPSLQIREPVRRALLIEGTSRGRGQNSQRSDPLSNA